MKAKLFATVSNGRIAAINDATPEHELLSNQFELSSQEFYLLKAVREIPDVDLVTHIHIIAEQIQSKLDGIKSHEQS